MLLQAQNDPDMFASFYDAYSERVLMFLTHKVLDAELAFDLMADTFTLALERRAQFRGSTDEEEQAWLFAIARSQLSHHWRRRSVEREALPRLAVEAPSLEDEHIERIERMAGLSTVIAELPEAMAQLPDNHRRAVELRVVEDLTYAELATVLGVTQQVARARVSRGLRALARELKDTRELLEETA